ncbi:hypothetical protein NC653_007143 [Populus alba x Populus x berolinensis]|uniref:Uncharacterized protein n=1 Tax=Populus alba x Populus x berolinensis TaxID=444605 RepID=A0AAD6RGD9_9ROSI|nr:hypothetical protein NC653_007143 [Populus alba x Populus x berolinensis]
MSSNQAGSIMGLTCERLLITASIKRYVEVHCFSVQILLPNAGNAVKMFLFWFVVIQICYYNPL